MLTEKFISFVKTIGFSVFNAWEYTQIHDYLPKISYGEAYILLHHEGLLLTFQSHDGVADDIKLHYMAISNNGKAGEDYLINSIDNGCVVSFEEDGVIVFNSKRIYDMIQLQTHIVKLFENSNILSVWKHNCPDLYFYIMDDSELNTFSKLSIVNQTKYKDACTMKHIMEGNSKDLDEVLFLIYG